MKLMDELRKHKVYNQYGFYGTQPHLWYRSGAGGWDSPAWMVSRRGMILDDFWMNEGAKDFDGPLGTGGWERRRGALAEAMAWTSEKFGVKEWAKDPFGGWQDIKVIRRVEAFLATQMEAKCLQGRILPLRLRA